MESIFLKLLNMSIAAGWLILAVFVLRLVLRRAPRWAICILWALVALRLVCPFTLESRASLIPSRETVSEYTVRYSAQPEITSGVEVIDSAVNPVFSGSFASEPAQSVNTLDLWMNIAGAVWAAGAAGMLIWALASWLRLRREVAESVPAGDGIRLCDAVDSPFILGIFRPVIYLPAGMDTAQSAHVIAHERAHIARRDNLWKPLGFLILSVYWFDPLVWAAYILFCRDIELACDERAVKALGLEERREYSRALLACSAPRRTVAACPLAFGEVGVKERVKKVLNYKKPAFRIVAAALAVCALAAVCFLTDPVEKKDGPADGADNDTPANIEASADNDAQTDAESAKALHTAMAESFFSDFASGTLHLDVYAGENGVDAAIALLESLREYAGNNSLTPEQYELLFTHIDGYDGAYTEGYAAVLRAAAQRDPQGFTAAWNELSAGRQNELEPMVGEVITPSDGYVRTYEQITAAPAGTETGMDYARSLLRPAGELTETDDVVQRMHFGDDRHIYKNDGYTVVTDADGAVEAISAEPGGETVPVLSADADNTELAAAAAALASRLTPGLFDGRTGYEFYVTRVSRANRVVSINQMLDGKIYTGTFIFVSFDSDGLSTYVLTRGDSDEFIGSFDGDMSAWLTEQEAVGKAVTVLNGYFAQQSMELDAEALLNDRRSARLELDGNRPYWMIWTKNIPAAADRSYGVKLDAETGETVDIIGAIG